MKHKMIGCSEECLEVACCDFCIYARHGFFSDKDGDIVRGGPVDVDCMMMSVIKISLKAVVIALIFIALELMRIIWL